MHTEFCMVCSGRFAKLIRFEKSILEYEHLLQVEYERIEAEFASYLDEQVICPSCQVFFQFFKVIFQYFLLTVLCEIRFDIFSLKYCAVFVHFLLIRFFYDFYRF